MKTRYVFDLDGTLLRGDFQIEKEFFTGKFGEEAIPFLQSIPSLLCCYERGFTRYDYASLSRYLKNKTGLDFDSQIIREWVAITAEIPSQEEEFARETLEFLKQKGCSLVVLTNWFGNSQTERLKRADLLSYFDEVYGGDISTKPHKEAYFNATFSYDPQECVFIGDDVVMDYIGPKSCAMDSILYDKENQHHKSLIKIKRLNELKERYK